MNDDRQTIRSFVAIELPAEVRAWCRAAIERAQRELGPAAAAVRWVDPEGIHLTLKFLGAVPSNRVTVIIDRVRVTLAGQVPFRLAVGRLGEFPGSKAPRVLWLSVLGDLPELGACQQRVDAAIVPLGFPSEKRPFTAHLTLGRVRETATPAQRALVGSLPAAWPHDTSPPFLVTSLSLMQSHLGPRGARYSQLAELPFD